MRPSWPKPSLGVDSADADGPPGMGVVTALGLGLAAPASVDLGMDGHEAAIVEGVHGPERMYGRVARWTDGMATSSGAANSAYTRRPWRSSWRRSSAAAAIRWN